MLLVLQMLCVPLAQAAPILWSETLTSAETDTLPPTVVEAADPPKTQEDTPPSNPADSVPEGEETSPQPTDPTEGADRPDEEQTTDVDSSRQEEETSLAMDVEGVPMALYDPVRRIDAAYGFHPYATPKEGTQTYSPLAVESSQYNVLNGRTGGWLPNGLASTGVLKDIDFGGIAYAGMMTLLQNSRVPDREFAGWRLYPMTLAEQSPALSVDVTYDKADLVELDPEMPLADIDPSYRWAPKEGVQPAITVVGRWQLSGNANARASVQDSAQEYREEKTALYPVKMDVASDEAIQLYAVDIATLPTAELPSATEFSSDVTEYYLRVPADVTAIKLDVLAAEPFLFWKDTPTPDHGVTVTASFSDRGVGSYTLNSTMLNVVQGLPGNIGYLPINTQDASACSMWTTDADNYISLQPSQGSGRYYNKVVVTITAPDGVTHKDYTFHIQRLNQPYLVQNPGNTPYGMIERDTALTPEEKTAAKAAFDSTRKLPGNLAVMESRYYQGTYWGPDGAGAFPIDQDPGGLALYMGDTFREPGVTLYNSVGDPIGDESGVTKTIEVKVPDKLTTDYIIRPGAAQAQTIRPDQDGLWTLGKRVAPQAYSMEYECVDPITGQTFHRNSSFVEGNQAYAATYTRAVIILPLPGDVDLDGTVTPADGFALEGILATLNGGGLTDAQKLFKQRVCDTANPSGPIPVGRPNGLLGREDVKALYNGFVPTWYRGNWFSLYYLPLEGSGIPQRASADGTGAKGALHLEYLGKKVSPAESPVISKSEELKKGDVFWVGIHTSGWSGPVGYTAVRTLSTTLLYDSRYLVPAVMGADGTLTGYTGEADFDQWKATMETYNLGGQNTSWPANMDWLDGSPADVFTDYDTKAETTLANNGTLKELKFSIKQKGETGVLINAAGQWMVRVPFLLKEQPVGTEQFHGLDISLGSGNFAGTLADPNTAGAQTKVTAWDMEGRLSDDFNLAKQFYYNRSRTTSATTLYLAPDGLEHTDLGTLIYGDAATVQGNFGQQDIQNPTKLPPGMSYDLTSNTISGIPLDTGTFRFVIGGKAYRLNVDPSPLEITPNDKAKYYGEETPALTFQYNMEQIKAIDRPGGANNPDGRFSYTGVGGELSQLSGHVTQGTLTTKTASDEGEEVGKTTSAGYHHILLEGWENSHYSFVFKDSDKVTTGVDDNCGQAQLEIKKRPFLASQITANPVEIVRVDTPKLVYEGKLARSGGSLTDGFVAALPARTGDQFQGLPLTGDAVLTGESVTISYTAAFTPDVGAAGNNKFVLINPQENRPVTISGVVLQEGEYSGNYQLFGPHPTGAVGRVVDRNIAKLEFVAPYPDNGLNSVVYTSGDAISFNGLTLKITYEALEGETAKSIQVKYQGPDSFAQYGLKTVLLTAKDAAPKEGKPLESEQVADYSLHHGKYFCVWLETGLGDQVKVVSTAAKEPLTIKKRLITIIPDQAGCFYGEDPNSAANGGSVSFRYSTASLTDADLAAAAVERADLLGTAQELRDILGRVGGEYKAPKAEVRYGVPGSTSPGPVLAGAPVSDHYFAIMAGASAKNYSFQYTQYNNLDAVRDDYGSRYYSIRPRPIVVERVTMSTSTNASDYYLYDDTASNRLETMYNVDGENIKPTALGGKAAQHEKDSFTALQPQVLWGGNTVPGYYPAGGSVEPVLLQADRLTGDALVGTDQVQVSYVATYTRDTGITNGNPCFQLPEGEAEGLRTVEISNLTLIGEQAKNYVLVYTLNSNAGDCFPEQKVVANSGSVRLRPIREMAVAADPTKMTYTYGQTLDFTGMKLKLTYETAGDNTLTYDPVKLVTYRRIPLGQEPDITFTDPFAQLGLHLKWEEKQSDAANYPAFQSANFGDYPTVAEHSGHKLVVYGRRHAAHDPLESLSQAPVVMKKASLTLTATDQIRYYGEPNGTYVFSFDPAQLSPPDRTILGNQTPQGEADSQTGTLLTSGAALSTALTGLTQGLNGQYYRGYQGPVFTTQAARGADVETYPLTLSGGTMDNYVFDYAFGDITVLKRPISISAITGTDAANPIYNIYFDTQETQYATVVDSGETPGFAAEKPNQNLAHSWTDQAFYGDDVLRLKLDLQFPAVASRGDRPAVTKPCDVTVTAVALADTQANSNYVLHNHMTSWNATGQLDNRNIIGVAVVQVPQTSYLYGQGMNLSGMKVQLTYSGQGVQPDVVYAERDDRVRVYYHDSANPPANVTGLQRCKPNDHLTIANQAFGTVTSFSHQNKYLVVQAAQSQGLDPTTPILVTDPNQGNRAVQIKLTPLDLTYRLTADSKVYDGTTTTNGQIALTNKYAGDDVIATAQFDFLDANVKYRDEGYTTVPGNEYWTGYQPDEVRDPANWHEERDVVAMPVLLSQILLSGNQAANYTIAKTLADLNGAKVGADDPGRGPVALSGHIGLTDNPLSGTRDRAPFATIRKADREAPAVGPNLSVDDHTNVVRVDYDEATHLETELTTSANTNAGVADDYQAEGHFEYMLEGESNQGVTLTWAGPDGTDVIQDTRFFGGEAVTPKAPVPVEGEGGGAFVPDVEEFPTEEELAEEDFVFQGQRYRWAEEDPGVVQNGSAYPGGEEYIRPGYELYATQRMALPRTTLLWTGVRMAATHNYNASPFTWSVEGDDKDQRAASARPVADQVTGQRLEELKQYGEKTQWPEEDYEFLPGIHAAVNTYTQRLDILSTEELDSQTPAGTPGGGGDGAFNVQTLEAVWFTDLMEYPESAYLDGAAGNDEPTRYRGYYWDEQLSAQLDFEGRESDSPLNLHSPITVTVKIKDEGGEREEEIVVNQDNTAQIFVSTGGGGGSILEERIEILPSHLVAYLGDAPTKLAVQFYPAYTDVKTVVWSSSDPSVATIHREKGTLTFHGLGVCTITARSINGRTATATVVVKDPILKPIDQGTQVGHFQVGYAQAYLTTDGEGRFEPERTMSRGELAELLAQFCVYNPEQPVQEGESPAFDDLADAPYADAVNLLVSRGIVQGTGEGFQGERLATRAEMAAMLARMLCIELPQRESGFHAFADAGPKDTWAWASIDALAGQNLARGIGEGLFAPGRSITYAEVAVFLDRVVQRNTTQGEAIILPVDVPQDYWAYESILRGLNMPPISETAVQTP